MNRKLLAVSLTMHTVALLFALGVLHGRSHIAPYKLPGTEAGTRLLTYFSSGTLEHAVNDVPTKAVEKHQPKPIDHVALAAAKPVVEAGAPAADLGSGALAQSGLGDGDIKIALQTYFPYPRPDLSGLPRGTHGDVILNAVIDEHGKISELSLVQGLGASVDETVIATVRQWTYTPALKNGVPVPSEQELHFHYERG